MNLEDRLLARDKLIEIFLKNNLIRIDKKYKRYKINRKKTLKNFVENNPIIKKLYELYINEFASEDEGLYCLTHLDDFSNHTCKYCNENVCDFNSNNYEYKNICNSEDCRKKSKSCEEVIMKRKATNLKKYGVDNPAKSSIIQEKIKQTNLERYGVANTFQVEEFKEKSKATNLEKYGCEYAMQSDEIKEKTKESCLEKYGVENVSQSDLIKNKKKNTTLKHYGVENPFQSEEIKEKSKATNLEKLGVEYAMQSEEIKEKSRETCMGLYGVEYIMQNEDIKSKVRTTRLSKSLSNETIISYEIESILKELDITNIPLIDIYNDKKLLTKFIEKLYKSKKNNDGIKLKELSSIFGFKSPSIKKRMKDLDLIDFIYIKESEFEALFKKFLDDNGIDYYEKNRSTIHNDKTKYNLEIDFILKNIPIAFEINDICSHNINSKDQDYHYTKTLKCLKLGIALIHIWEWELTDVKLWNRLNKWILNMISNSKINVDTNKDNCIVKIVPLNEEKEFLNNYHLQGYIKSELCLGLYYNNELIQLMSFCKSRFNKNYEYELLRLCTKYGYEVINGSNKLLNYFINNYKPKSIISYCNLDKFNGKVYEELGFKLLQHNTPQIIWYNPDTEDHFLHTSLLLKGADKLIGTNYGKGTDNEEIVIRAGYKKCYNCGLNVYTLTF